MSILLSCVFSGTSFSLSDNAPQGIWLFIPPLHEIIISAICFALIIFIVVKKVAPSFLKTLDERTKEIEVKIEQASQAMDDATRLQKENQEQLKKASIKANEIILSANENAKNIIENAQKQAIIDSQKTIENAQKQILANQQLAVTQANKEIKLVAINLAKEVLGSKLSKQIEFQEELIHNQIKKD